MWDIYFMIIYIRKHCFSIPFWVGFSISGFSNLSINGRYSCKKLLYSGEDNVELQYINTDSVMFSFSLIEGLILDLKHLSKDFERSEIDPTREIYSKDNMIDTSKKKLESSPSDLDAAVFLVSKSNNIGKTSKSIESKHKVYDHIFWALQKFT